MLYALLTNKRQDLYLRVLRKFVTVARVINGQEPTPQLIISDFEMAIINAMEEVFPAARFQGCLFHYGQV
jgi:transposase-like protein